jgi:Mrp family chromosome partitioning ATPase
MNKAQAEEALAMYLALQREAQREMTELTTRIRSVQALRESQQLVEDNLQRARERLESLRVEKSQGRTGRVTVAQLGDIPLFPAKDRRLALSGVGALGGFGAGFAIVFLLTFLDRSYRFTDEIERLGLDAPLLGALPELGNADPEQEEIAALSVHHLRNMVLLHPPLEVPDPKVYTVTSAGAGDGKTSLSLSLGMSFAASGMHTLLVDADLLGRGLTRSLQMDGTHGLAEALEHNSVAGAVHETSFANLWAMPAGRDGAIEPERLNKRDLARVTNAAREKFDIVLIDTGPLLGSLEANLVAGLSDAVVLVVSRGQDSKLVNACIQRLRRIGVHCAGVVFNRAEVQDFERSFAAGSVSSVRSTRSRRPDDSDRGAGSADRGLVRALSTSEEPRKGAPV